MKKHIIFLGLFAICSILIITAFVSDECNDAHLSVTQKVNDEYTLKDYNGRIAIFHTDSIKPVKIFDIQTASLPEQDKEKLKIGIKASTYEEILRLASDYTS